MKRCLSRSFVASAVLLSYMTAFFRCFTRTFPSNPPILKAGAFEVSLHSSPPSAFLSFLLIATSVLLIEDSRTSNLDATDKENPATFFPSLCLEPTA